MAQEEYPLDVLIELRERDRDEAERDLATEMAELDRREKEVEAEKKRYAEAVGRRRQRAAERDDALASGISVMALRGMDDFDRALEVDEQNAAKAIETARKAVGAQRLVVDKSRRRLEETQKELLAVEKHFEAWQDEAKLIQRRKASDDMDEIAIRRWMEENG